jgi:predicted transposase/invertase (TIGR01784 family)
MASDGQMYSIPTYDAIFKLVLSKDEIRPSFLKVFLPGLHIKSSERIDEHINPVKEMQLIRDFLHSKETGDCMDMLAEDLDFLVNVKKKDISTPCQTSTRVFQGLVKYFSDLKSAFPKAEYNGVMDFVCKLDTGDSVLVEMQVMPHDNWDQRALTYVAALYAKQIRQGGDWKKIKKVIGINILGGGKNQVAHWTESPEQFVQLHPERKIMEGIEIIQYSIMNAPKNIEDQETKDWLTYFQKAHLMTEKEVLATIKTPAVLEAFKTAKYDLLPSEVRDQYIKEDKSYSSISIYAKQREDKGRTEGFTEGIAKGRAEEKKEVACNLLKIGIDPSAISQATGLSEEEILSLKS